MAKKVAVIVGSVRTGSINRKLALAISKMGGDRLEFDFIPIDKLPMFNEDLEANRPAEANAFSDAVRKADAVLIVTPEYNRSLPALLKNAIDWGSRPGKDSVWKKPAAITGTSPGGVGTAAVQQHLRTIMGNLGCTVLPGEMYIQFKPDLIDDAGKVSVEATEKFLQGFVDRFADLVEKLS